MSELEDLYPFLRARGQTARDLDAALLHSIEVKAREAEGAAAEAITARQRSRIERAAALYLGAHPALRQKAVRFDAILATPRRWPRHVKDAWRPES